MSIATIAPTKDANAERWRQWQLAYTESSRKVAKRARIVFTVVLTALAAALGLQLPSRQPWA
jgi:type IV secretory pathway component VirB8